MKELKLMVKEIKLEIRPEKVRCPQCGEFALKMPMDIIKTSFADMLKACLEGIETNRKGLLRINRVLKILDKIQKAEDEKSEKILLEDNDFGIIYESSDKFEWGVLAMRFPEFFIEVEEANHRKVEVTKKEEGDQLSMK